MGAWAGYLGPGSAETLAHLLGPGGESQVGNGFGLGIRRKQGESACLTAGPNGRLIASVGIGPDAGSSATVDPVLASLVLERDPFGLHGAYLARVGTVWWAASDLRLLRQVPGVSSQIDSAALHGYLCFSYVPNPLSIVSGVETLPAGGRVTLTAAGRAEEPEALWKEQENVPYSEAEAAESLLTHLCGAVSRCLDGAEEVGVFLSGGLDSSLVAALLCEAGVRVHLFTLDFGPPFDVELAYARQVASHLQRPLHVVSARPRQVRAALEATAAALEQPFGDGVTVPLYLLGRAAADYAPTIFNGEGGDQLFGGWTHKPMVAAELYGEGDYDREAAYLATYHRFYGWTDALYTDRAKRGTDGVDVGSWVCPALHAEGFGSLLHRLRAANLRLKGAQNIAPRALQLAQAHGLRMRAPFFDRALAEWTFRLPPEWFLAGACEKYLLKRVAERYLPAEVVWREKRGMGVPVTEWCLGPLRREIARRLSARRMRRDGWFEPDFVTRLRRGEEQPGDVRRRRVGERLWTLLMLHLWLDVQPAKLLFPNRPHP